MFVRLFWGLKKVFLVKERLKNGSNFGNINPANSNQNLDIQNQKRKNTKIKLGIITNTYTPDKNGISRAVSAMEKELELLGAEVYLIVPRTKGVYYPNNILALDGANLPKSVSDDLKLLNYNKKEIVRFFSGKQVNVVHTHDTLFGGIEGSDIAKSLGVPCVHTFHTMIEDYDYAPFIGYRKLMRRLIKEVCNSYDAVICPSNKSITYLKSLKIKTNLYQIFNVVYLKTQKLTLTPEISQKYEYLRDDSKFTFIVFCRLDSYKNIDTTIEYLESILSSNPGTRLIIAGGGPERSELEDLVVELGLNNSVTFTGTYNPLELKAIVEHSKPDLFIFTSTSDNLPTNVLEAVSFSIPVISIDRIATDYIVKENENGYFFGTKEEFVRLCQNLVNNPNELKKLKDNCQRIYDQFCEGDYAQQHINLYRFLIDRQLASDDFSNKNKITKVISKNFKKTLDKIKEGVDEVIGS